MTSDGLAAAKSFAAKLSITGWLLFVGFVLAVIATFFPYAVVSADLLGSIEISANGSAKFVVFLLAAVAAGLAWPVLSGSPLAVWRLVGLSAVAAVLGFLMIKWFSDASSSQAGGEVNVSPGFGLLLYGAAVVAIVVGVVRLWIDRSRTQKQAY
jgi:hypothetical protein